MTRFHPAFVLVLVLITLVATPLSAQQDANRSAVIPWNMQVNPVLVQVVTELLAASPAFAAQCAHIADARFVRITINPVMASSTTSRGSARTAMRRFAAGALLAVVDIPVPLTISEYGELFGHELEHVLEQIDGVDLQAMTDARGGASRLADGAYETARARRAGLLIAEQVERPHAAAARARSAISRGSTAAGVEGAGGTGAPSAAGTQMAQRPTAPGISNAAPAQPAPGMRRR